MDSPPLPFNEATHNSNAFPILRLAIRASWVINIYIFFYQFYLLRPALYKLYTELFKDKLKKKEALSWK